MIVPRSRLLRLVAAVVLPFATVAATVPGTAPIALPLIVGALAVAVGDALLAPRRVRGLRVELPPITRLSLGRLGHLELRLRNTPPKARQVRLGLPFPAEITSPIDEQQTVLPEGIEWSRLPWPCTGLKRGRYRLDGCYLEAISPLGLWAARGHAPVAAELRVYLGLFEERTQLSALFLNRGQFGLHPRRQVGKGREFEKLREYAPGDSFDEIHWKATAKRSHPITKVFRIERTQEVYVLLDTSRLSARKVQADAPHRDTVAVRPGNRSLAPASGPPQATMLDRFIAAALVLGLAAEGQGDRFGLVTFSSQVINFLPARNGWAHYRACRDAIYTLEPRLETPDFAELFSFLRLRLRRRALLLFLTSLDDPVLAEGFVRNLDAICRQHVTIVGMLRPPAVAPVFAESPPDSVDDLYAALGGHLRWHELRELGRVLQHRGVALLQLDNTRMCAQLVSQYLEVKQRQLL